MARLARLLVLETKGSHLEGSEDTEFKAKFFALLEDAYTHGREAGEVELFTDAPDFMRFRILIQEAAWQNEVERRWLRRTKKLAEMSAVEWESLCDGCARCCLNKLEYEDTGEIDWTEVACRLLDGTSCRCGDYRHRHELVADCLALTAENVPNSSGCRRPAAIAWSPRAATSTGGTRFSPAIPRRSTRPAFR